MIYLPLDGWSSEEEPSREERVLNGSRRCKVMDDRVLHVCEGVAKEEFK